MAEQTVTLQPNESKAVSFEAIPHEAKTYQVTVDGLSGSFIAIPALRIRDFRVVYDVGTGSTLTDGDILNWPERVEYIGFRVINESAEPIGGVSVAITIDGVALSPARDATTIPPKSLSQPFWVLPGETQEVCWDWAPTAHEHTLKGQIFIDGVVFYEETITFNVMYDNEGALGGTVTDALSGAVLPGVSVTASGWDYRYDPFFPTPVVRTTVTDENGYYDFWGLPVEEEMEQTYTVTFEHPDYQTHEEDVVLRENLKQLDIALYSSIGELYGNVTHASTGDVLEAVLIRLRTGGYDEETESAYWGYRFIGLTIGNYDAKFHKVGYVDQTHKITILPGVNFLDVALVPT